MLAARPSLHVATENDALRPLDAARLMREPPAREWMVEGCFAKGTVGMVSGDGGIGKSPRQRSTRRPGPDRPR